MVQGQNVNTQHRSLYNPCAEVKAEEETMFFMLGGDRKQFKDDGDGDDDNDADAGDASDVCGGGSERASNWLCEPPNPQVKPGPPGSPPPSERNKVQSTEGRGIYSRCSMYEDLPTFGTFIG